MSNFHTSDQQITEIADREGYRAKAYQADSRTPTGLSGYGQENFLFPGTQGQIEVIEGLEIDRRVAWDALCFFVYNVVDPLVTEYCNPRSQAEHDACASWVYNIRHSRLRQDGYTFPKLVRLADRSPEHMDRIINCLLEYCLTPGAETGLFRRRLVEALDFQGLPTTPEALGFIQSARVSRLDGGQVMGNAAWVHPTGKYCATVDPGYVFQVAEGVKQKTEDEITEDLNAAQLEKLGGKPAAPSQKPVRAKKVSPVPAPAPKPVEAPHVDLSAPPKPMEQSTTAKGMSHKDSGRETAAIGAVTTTGVFAMLPYAEKIAAFAERTNPQVILVSIGVVAGVVLLVGLVRWWVGRMQMYEGRQQATETKI
jgi:GH24 family phage-related lysozyme (muramidase)